MVAADIVEMKQGGRENFANCEHFPRAAAELLTTDVAGVDRARSVISRAAPEIVQAAREGKVSVAAAAEIAAQPAARQAEIIKNLPRDDAGRLTPDVKKALGPVIKELRAEKVAAKKEKRAQREETLGRRLQALPANNVWRRDEDFEWDHEPWSRDHRRRAASKHALRDRRGRAYAGGNRRALRRALRRLADTCILLKWTTGPHANIAMKVLELQGFKYVTQLVWNRSASATRAGRAIGSPVSMRSSWSASAARLVPAGRPGNLFLYRTQLTLGAIGEHSQKPPNVHEIVEFHWPNLPKVEFKTRGARAPGWTPWGFDAPEIADDGEGSHTVDCPAPAADGVSSGSGIVDSNAGWPSKRPSSKPPFRRRIGPGLELQPQESAGGASARYTRHFSAPSAQAGRDGPDAARSSTPGNRRRRDADAGWSLTEDELRLHGALTSVAAGQNVDGSIVRDLVGADFVRVTTDRLIVTEAGRTFLAQLVPAALSGGIAA